MTYLQCSCVPSNPQKFKVFIEFGVLISDSLERLSLAFFGSRVHLGKISQDPRERKPSGRRYPDLENPQSLSQAGSLSLRNGFAWAEVFGGGKWLVSAVKSCHLGCWCMAVFGWKKIEAMVVLFLLTKFITLTKLEFSPLMHTTCTPVLGRCLCLYKNKPLEPGMTFLFFGLYFTCAEGEPSLLHKFLCYSSCLLCCSFLMTVPCVWIFLICPSRPSLCHLLSRSSVVWSLPHSFSSHSVHALSCFFKLQLCKCVLVSLDNTFLCHQNTGLWSCFGLAHLGFQWLVYNGSPADVSLMQYCLAVIHLLEVWLSHFLNSPNWTLC